MFFRHSDERKKRSLLPLTIIRLFISLVLFLVLGVALIQAFKYFSGISAENDPFTKAITRFPSDPKGAIKELLTSEETAKTIVGILSFSPVKDLKLPIGQANNDQNPSLIEPEKGNLLFKFALVTDSHNNNNEGLAKALEQARADGAKFVIGLGDFTDTGTIEELDQAKKVFDDSKFPYYVIPGDHDLWDARDKGKIAVSNFSQVFGTPYQAFTDSGIRFILLYNSDNYYGVSDLQSGWLKDELDKDSKNSPKAIYIFLHEPLVHPTSDRVMGSEKKADPGTSANEKIQAQAKELLDIFNKAKVAGIFAGDIHAFTTYIDSATNIKMATIGALTKEKNTEPPRFATVDVFDGGGYNISDIEIK